jgi:hypothetical protein
MWYQSSNLQDRAPHTWTLDHWVYGIWRFRLGLPEATQTRKVPKKGRPIMGYFASMGSSESVICTARPQLENGLLDSTWNSHRYRTLIGLNLPHYDDQAWSTSGCQSYEWLVKIMTRTDLIIVGKLQDKHHGESQIYMYSSWLNVIRRSDNSLPEIKNNN